MINPIDIAEAWSSDSDDVHTGSAQNKPLQAVAPQALNVEGKCVEKGDDDIPEVVLGGQR